MSEILSWPPSWSTLLLLPALFVGFTVHELGHAVVAYLLGDTSQVERHRLSFNPLRHVSWVGLVVFLLFRFGWAKPVWVDISRLRVNNRAFGMFLVSVAGASANLVMGMVALLGMAGTLLTVWTATGASPLEVWEFLTLPGQSLDAHGVAVALSGYMVEVNLVLAFFNLLPFPPLDGFQAMMSLVAAIRKGLGRDAVPGPGLRPVQREVVSDQPEAGWESSDEPDTEQTVLSSPAQIHFDIGLEYHKAGQLDEAIARYRQATAHDAQFGLAYFNLGVAYWEKGRFPLALSAFRAALTCPDMAVRTQAGQRLRELVVAERNPDAEPPAVPAPLEPGAVNGQGMEGPLPPDPAMTRRVLLSLAAGGAGALLLAVVAWFYVTTVALGELGGGGLP